MLQRAGAASHKNPPATAAGMGGTSRSLLDWLDARTGYRRGFQAVFGRILPESPSWGHSIGVCLLWMAVMQIATGFLLMTTYSPSLSTAWASVHFIERDAAGAFLRGLHHFSAQAIILLLFAHLVRVLLKASFRAPRELIWISGLLLVPLVLAWAVTGNPLPGSQRGIAQIDVEGNIVGSTPWVGPIARRVLIGGDQVGNLTLTHLYFLHVALLPLLAGGLLGVHLWQICRHGVSSSQQPVPSAAQLTYWPHQTIRNLICLTVVLGTVAALAGKVGAPLEMPADAEFEHAPRPEWYFLSLFELRRYFNGQWEMIATVVIPLAVLSFLLCVPLIDARCTRRTSSAFRYGVVIVCGVAWGWLTLSSMNRDRNDAEYRASEAQLQSLSTRARQLADARGIPVEGAASLLHDDPKTQGPRLFARHCLACHSHSSAQGQGLVAREPSAPNLYRFGSRDWIAGLFDPQRIGGPDYFGHTKAAKGDMAEFVHKTFGGSAAAEKRSARASQIAAVAVALSAEAARSEDADLNRRDQARVGEGIRLMKEEFGCTDCHRFRDRGDLGSAPELTGYGSREWLQGMISDPNHERFYGNNRNDRMPAFRAKPQAPSGNLLSPRELDLLIDWLRWEWYKPVVAKRP